MSDIIWDSVVTGGGVALDEVDLHTFESRLHRGLYSAGEVLDVWGRSGGYNLHFAWASGIAVGEAVALPQRAEMASHPTLMSSVKI